MPGGLSAIVAFVLIQARLFVDTPSLTDELQATPSPDSVNPLRR